MTYSFNELLEGKWAEGKFLCVGLDPDYTLMPKAVKKPGSIEEALILFNLAIIDATQDIVCAFKPNSAFYEAYGTEGFSALKKTCEYLKSNYPHIPIILDAKRADIGNTNDGYTKMAFEYLKVDAITLHPYMGEESLKPFLNYKDKGLIILVKTSNPGAGEFQDLKVGKDKKPLYKIVAENVTKKWNKYHNCAVVVGATFPKELKEVRQIVQEMPILIPGIGKQGGDIAQTVHNGKNTHSQGMIINSARAIIYASNKKDFAHAARQVAEKTHKLITRNL